ncbi:MAG: helix-turn-helix domain-containing protein [Clostridia bacterium]|nr:helix-turn-helix domain-containing protein [Clostridia bacterium]
MEITQNKGYIAIIPAVVRYDKDLKPSEKLLFGEISALMDAKGFCWASNKYFAELYDVAIETVSRWITHLVKKGYVKSKIVYAEDGKTVLQRKLWAMLPVLDEDEDPIDEKIKGIDEKIKTPLDEKIKTPIDEKVKENVTSNELTRVNDKEINKESQLKNDFEELWKLYPRKRGKEAAYKAYKKAIKEGTTNEEIRQGIMNLLEDIRKNRTEERFIPYGSTFFNGKGWTDELGSEIRFKTCGDNRPPDMDLSIFD